MISFQVPAIPVAQPRQRVTVSKSGHARTYTPTKHPANVFKATCQMAVQAVYQGGPLEGPLSIAIAFVLPRPKSTLKKHAGRRLWHAKRPDFDNLCKSLMDALSGILWRDDSQICIVTVKKLVAAEDESPCCYVSLDTVEIDDL